MEIYVLIDDKAQGPYTRELICKYLNSGQLKPTDLAAYAGRADWKPLSTLIQSWRSSAASKGTQLPSAIGDAASSKRKLLVAVIAVGAVLVVIAGGFTFWKLHKPAARGITGSGSSLPNSLTELNAMYAEPPAGQNAALFYLKGLDSMEISQADLNSADLPVLGHGAMPALGEPLSPRARASMADLLQRNESALIALQQGTAFEQARYPIDLTQGSDTLLPHLIKIKRAIQLNQLRTMMYADDKQPQDAADSLLLSLALARSLKDEPVLISQLVRVAGNAISMASLDYTLNSVAIPPGDLERLSAAFAVAESQESAGNGFTRALVAERVGAFAFLDLPSDRLEEEIRKIQGYNRDNPSLPRNLSAQQLMQNLKLQRAFLGETFDHALAMRDVPFPGRLKVDEYLAARTAEAKGKEFYLCQIWLAGISGGTKREAKGLSNLRLAQTAIALERFRQEKKNYPDSLTALVPKFLPEVPTDPANGGELRYETKGGTYEVSSTAINAPKPQSIMVVKPPRLAF